MHPGLLIQGVIFTFTGIVLTVEIFRSCKSGSIGRLTFSLKNFSFVFRKDEPKKFFFLLVIYLATDLFFLVLGVAGLLYYFGFL